MKPLSLRQASNCEQAREPVCHCRCGGRLHGAQRGTGLAFFEGLPADDPHKLPTAADQAAAKAARAAEKKRARDAVMQRRYDALASLYAARARDGAE